MKLRTRAPHAPSFTRPCSPGLDIVVPFTTSSLTRAALTAAKRLSAGLTPLVRVVKVQVVPFPLQLEATPVSATVLRRNLAPVADQFGAYLQICFTRDSKEGLLQTLALNSVVVIAARRRWWKSREQRLAEWLRHRGGNVVLEFVEKNRA